MAQRLQLQIDCRHYLTQIQAEDYQFERIYTTPDHLPKLKPFGKMLGPKGLMPNLKVGTLAKLEILK